MNSQIDRLRSFFKTYERVLKPDVALTRAGVLVPLFEKNGETHFLLTKRTQDVEHHKGQVSFPGGAVDKGDRDIVTTALRESEEEIGLPALNPMEPWYGVSWGEWPEKYRRHAEMADRGEFGQIAEELMRDKKKI